MRKSKTCKEIIKEYLIKNDFDGLCGEECGCELDDLFCCYEGAMECSPGYKVKDKSGEYEHVFSISKRGRIKDTP